MSAVDVAIVGPGTVGLFLAHALGPDPHVAVVGGDLDRHEQLGAVPRTAGHRGALDGWAGGLGGTSRRWGGQLWPWRAWETEATGWHDAWPLDFARDLAPHYSRALRRLGLDAEQRDAIHDRGAGMPLAGFAADGLEVRYSTWMDRRHRDFVRNRALDLAGRPRTRFIPANAAAIRPVPNGHQVIGRDGAVLVTARRLVLAAGTIGNVRLAGALLAASGVANDWLGRGFGDHLSARAAVAEVVDRRRFEDFAAPRYIRHGRATARLATTARLSADLGVLPAYAHFEVASPLVDAARALRGGAGGAGLLRSEARSALPRLPARLRAAGSAARRRHRPLDPSARVHLRIDMEQPLRREARIGWSRAGDLDVAWSVGPEERTTAERLLTPFRTVAEQHLGVRLQETGIEPMTDIFHLMGGTRMTGGRDGVVDPRLRLLDADDVWVLGASTYPSGGMANPTFTALALAERAADELR